MSRYLRPRISGASVFFTVALADRSSRVLADHVGTLREAVRQTIAERPFRIDALVILPDHLHAVWTLPEGDADYSTRWRLIKTRFSRELPVGPLRASHEARQERGIWQRRFWERHIRDEADVAAHIRYCWWNPVKHGFVERPEELAPTRLLAGGKTGSGDPEQACDFLKRFPLSGGKRGIATCRCDILQDGHQRFEGFATAQLV
jgi:putative transposase